MGSWDISGLMVSCFSGVNRWKEGIGVVMYDVMGRISLGFLFKGIKNEDM